MKLAGSIAFIIATILLCGCAPKTVVVMKDYKNKTLPAKSLAVVLLVEKPAISNPNDIIDDFGNGVPEDIFMNMFEEIFPAAIKSKSICKSVTHIKDYPENQISERTLAISDAENLKIRLPADGNTVQFDSIQADFILFVDQIKTSKVHATSGHFVPGTAGQPGHHTGGTAAKLRYQSHFAFWDNEKGQMVSYGRIENSQSFMFHMSDNTWKQCTHGLAEQILRQSPFARPIRLN